MPAVGIHSLGAEWQLIGLWQANVKVAELSFARNWLCHTVDKGPNLLAVTEPVPKI